MRFSLLQKDSEPMKPTRNPPRPRWLLAPLVLLSLTGCFDLLEEIWLLPDGSARVVFDVGLPKTILNAAKLKGEDPLEQFRQEARATAEELKKDPDVKAFEFRDYEDEEQHHLVYDLTVGDARRLGELHQRAMERMNSASKDQKTKLGFHIERRGMGEYVFVQRLGEPKDEAAGSGARQPSLDGAMKDLGRQMARKMMGDHHFIVRVHGPAIEETNGTLNEEKNTVEWKHSLVDLAEPAGGGLEMRAVVKTGPPAWLWSAMLGVPLLVLMMAVAAARGRKRGSGAA
jgi:hypothetical protein